MRRPFLFPPSSRHSGPKAWGYWVVATLGLLSFSTTLRTQVRPAIEFVSGKEGLRPRIAVFVSSYCILRVQLFLEFGYWDTLKFASAPGLSGGRGEMAMAVASSARLAFLRGAVCACCTLHQTLSLGPCTAMVH